jgi:hypothetical protein
MQGPSTCFAQLDFLLSELSIEFHDQAMNFYSNENFYLVDLVVCTINQLRLTISSLVAKLKTTSRGMPRCSHVWEAHVTFQLFQPSSGPLIGFWRTGPTNLFSIRCKWRQVHEIWLNISLGTWEHQKLQLGKEWLEKRSWVVGEVVAVVLGKARWKIARWEWGGSFAFFLGFIFT